MASGHQVIPRLLKGIPGEEFDHQVLLDILSGYAHPRAKISSLLRQKVIVQVKKGIYLLGPDYARRAFSREILANIIYGPSYISFQWALHHYGLTPERVDSVTSATRGRPHRFLTPVGLFLYRPVPPRAFAVGVDQAQTEDGRSYLIATPEKALADTIHGDRRGGLRALKDVRAYLLEDLRVDLDRLNRLSLNKLRMAAEAYQSHKVWLLARFVASLGKPRR